MQITKKNDSPKSFLISEVHLNSPGTGVTTEYNIYYESERRNGVVVKRFLHKGIKSKEEVVKVVAQDLDIFSCDEPKKKDRILSGFSNEDIKAYNSIVWDFIRDDVLPKAKYLGYKFGKNGEVKTYTNLAESYIWEYFQKNLRDVMKKQDANYKSIIFFGSKHAAREIAKEVHGWSKHQLDMYNRIMDCIEQLVCHKGIREEDVSADDVYNIMKDTPGLKMSYETTLKVFTSFKNPDLPIEVMDYEERERSVIPEPTISENLEYEEEKRMLMELLMNMDRPVSYTLIRMQFKDNMTEKKLCKDSLLEDLCESEGDETLLSKMKAVKLRKANSGKIKHKLTEELVRELYQRGLRDIREFMDENGFNHYDFTGHIDGLVDELMKYFEKVRSEM